jgi:adenine C2-methylase RlmN of 23S rRNA A2503 and tRNA A37
MSRIDAELVAEVAHASGIETHEWEEWGLAQQPDDVEVITGTYQEEADGGLGMKTVFIGKRASDGKIATFETGSFFDNGGVNDAPDKHDICISTAGGCTRSCTFCSVPGAELGFERLLTPREIVFQALYMMADRNPDDTMPNVIGLMGNGEPPDNKAILPAVAKLALLPNVDRITISTIGENVRGVGALATMAAKLDTDTPVKLQFSLHAADWDKRRVLVPGKASKEKVLTAVDNYAEVTGEAVKFNVVLMDGVKGSEYDGFTNASPEDAKLLAELLHSESAASGQPLGRRLKLSAYNPVPGKPFTAPSEEARALFVDTLLREGITQIKTFKGSGIEIDEETGTGGFACGQLRATTAQQGLTN